MASLTTFSKLILLVAVSTFLDSCRAPDEERSQVFAQLDPPTPSTSSSPLTASPIAPIGTGDHSLPIQVQSPPPSTSPVPAPTFSTLPSPSSSPISGGPSPIPTMVFDDPRKFAREALEKVDQSYGDHELLKDRKPATQTHASDHCQLPETPGNGDLTFSDPIGTYIDDGLVPKVKSLGGNESLFSVPSSSAHTQPVGLLSQPFCPLDGTTLRAILGRPASQSTLNLAQTFVHRSNDLANLLKNSRQDLVATAREKSIRHWSQFFGCLAYTESLTTADSSTSDRIAREVAPPDFHRPKGVLFYRDPSQSNPVSALNLGLFQFSPAAGGNVQACIRDWNKTYLRCPIPQNASKDEMIRILGSAFQSFNTYCAVQKVLQPFYIQVNTTNSTLSHPNNRNSAGALLPPKNRCVTLHHRRAYVHFGPLIDSTGINLKEVLTCALE